MFVPQQKIYDWGIVLVNQNDNLSSVRFPDVFNQETEGSNRIGMPQG
jgi:hypothetical protein